MASTEAAKEWSRQWYHRNRERQLLLRKQYYEKNKESFKRWNKAWKENNRDRVKELRRIYSGKLPFPKYVKKWTRNSRFRRRFMEFVRYHLGQNGKVNNRIKSARRRASVCGWSNEEKIQAFYSEAARLTTETGIKHVVDHIVPLKNKHVCGLHNEFNLRAITQRENAMKKNKFEVV